MFCLLLVVSLPLLPSPLLLPLPGLTHHLLLPWAPSLLVLSSAHFLGQLGLSSGSQQELGLLRTLLQSVFVKPQLAGLLLSRAVGYEDVEGWGGGDQGMCEALKPEKGPCRKKK